MDGKTQEEVEVKLDDWWSLLMFVSQVTYWNISRMRITNANETDDAREQKQNAIHYK